MSTILDRMRLERRITLVILAIFIAVAFLHRLFFPSWTVVSVDPARVQPATTSSEKP